MSANRFDHRQGQAVRESQKPLPVFVSKFPELQEQARRKEEQLRQQRSLVSKHKTDKPKTDKPKIDKSKADKPAPTTTSSHDHPVANTVTDAYVYLQSVVVSNKAIHPPHKLN